MTDSRAARLAPLSGIAFAVLALLGFGVLAGNSPGAGASAAKVVSFYHGHSGREVAAGVVIIAAAIFLLAFAATLREALPPGFAATTAHAGLLVVVIGLLLQSAAHIALTDAGNDHLAQPAQALNMFDSYTFLVTLPGLFAMLVVAAVASLKHAALQTWLGWVAAVLAVAMVTPVGWIASAFAILWIAAVGIVLSRRAGRSALEYPLGSTRLSPAGRSPLAGGLSTADRAWSRERSRAATRARCGSRPPAPRPRSKRRQRTSAACRRAPTCGQGRAGPQRAAPAGR
jgi:hypothetical protein